jgi:transposase InsO family protein
MIGYPLNALYRAAGVSKQAVHQARRRTSAFHAQLEPLLLAMDELRAEHPGCGLEKAYYSLRPAFLGRDRFIALMQQVGYGGRRRASRPRTTQAGVHRFANLIEGGRFDGAGQVWQSDLTYFDLGGRFAYIVFLIDIYTKVIVGYRVSEHLRATANLEALSAAIGRFGAPSIHHSDRGGQYGSQCYLDLLCRHSVAVSMSKTGPENAYAERINGTIKNEYLAHWSIGDVPALRRGVARAVGHYNAHRPHNHLGRRTPLAFHESYRDLPREQRPVVTIPTFTSQPETVNLI